MNNLFVLQNYSVILQGQCSQKLATPGERWWKHTTHLQTNKQIARVKEIAEIVLDCQVGPP